MRILFIHTKYKERGGEDSVVESEIQLLRQYGHDVEVLYFDNAKNSFLNVWLMPFNPFSYRRTLRTINRFKPEVVHLHNLHFGASFSAVWATIRKRVPVVKTLHNYRFLCPSATLFHNNELYLGSLSTSFPWQAVKDKVYRHSTVLTFWLAFAVWIQKRLGTFRKIDRYITLNEKSRDIFLASDLQLKRTQIITKPNFIPQTAAASVPARGNQFLYVGRLSPEKGIDVLLKAFSGTGMQLRIIGDGPLREDVTRCAESNPNIQWLGFQNKESIHAEMQTCNALIVPSVCFEGMPLTIVEGFAAGAPVITSKLGAMETIVTDGKDGLHFTPNDAVSLQLALDKWSHLPPEEKKKFSQNALTTYADKYTPAKHLSAILAIYQELICNGTKPAKKQHTKSPVSITRLKHSA